MRAWGSSGVRSTSAPAPIRPRPAPLIGDVEVITGAHAVVAPSVVLVPLPTRPVEVYRGVHRHLHQASPSVPTSSADVEGDGEMVVVEPPSVVTSTPRVSIPEGDLNVS